MKFTLAQLMKLPMPYEFTEEMDLSSDLNGIDGIIKVENTQVAGIVRPINRESYSIDFTVKCKLILECAITLKEIPYDINISFKEIFSTADDDRAFKIEGQTLDTTEAVITNILIAKPMKVVADGAYFEDECDDFEDDSTDEVNSPFASLKDLL